MILQSTNSDETIKNSIHSFIKMIYFNPKSINDVCLELLKEMLHSDTKSIHNLGLFCLFSISLYKLTINHLRKIEAIPLLIKKLESGKYEKRVYSLKIILNFMEISDLDSDLLRENDFKLFDFLLYFIQSDLQEEQRLATRGLSKLPLQILKDRNPKIMPPIPEPTPILKLESISHQVDNDIEQKTIQENSSESSMSEKSSKVSLDSKVKSKSTKTIKHAESGPSENDLKVKQSNRSQTNDKEEKQEDSLSDSSDSDSQDSSSDKSSSPTEGKGNIHSLINHLSTKIRPRNSNESDITYFSLYSVFNLLLQININNPNMKSEQEESKTEPIPMSQKHWNDISTNEFNMMLIDCNIISNVIALLTKTKDDDIICVSLKIIILLSFKVPMKRIMNFEASSQTKFWVSSCISSDSENTNYYNFQSFIGYVLHKSRKEEIEIESFMTEDMMKTFVIKLCNDFREDELLELNSKGNNSKKKMIIYKFFFVSYLVSLIIQILHQKCIQIDLDIRLRIKQLCCNFIEICQGFKLSELGLSKLLQNPDEKTKPRDEQRKVKLEGRSSIIGVIISLCMKTLLLEISSSQKNEDADFNILDRRTVNVFHNDPKEEQMTVLNKKICQLILNNLTKFEDVGEIVELTYKYLSCFFENTSADVKNQYTELLENSKMLISQGVKHIAVYGSESALKFLNLLIGSSSKYKNKTEIDNALRNLMNNGRNK